MATGLGGAGEQGEPGDDGLDLSRLQLAEQVNELTSTMFVDVLHQFRATWGEGEHVGATVVRVGGAVDEVLGDEAFDHPRDGRGVDLQVASQVDPACHPCVDENEKSVLGGTDILGKLGEGPGRDVDEGP